MPSRRTAPTPEPERVLTTWQMLEQFSPQAVPKLSARASSDSHQTVDWHPGDPVPWDTLPAVPASARRKDGKQKDGHWEHVLYLGLYDIAAIYEAVRRAFGEDVDAYDRRAPNKSACAALSLDGDGGLRAGSHVLSAAAWAVGRASAPGPKNSRWLAGFDESSAGLGEKIDQLQARRRDDSKASDPPPADGEAIASLLSIVHRQAGISAFPEFATSTVRISSTYRTRNAEALDSGFLNSFVLDDLVTLRQAMQNGDAGPALREYLASSDSPPRGRIDVRENLAAVDDVVRPEHIPAGRWPSDPCKPLALSQQFAVNRALGDLDRNPGLIAVNGPPGTGKTTMLRDVLAGLVVERARAIHRLKSPKDAFTGSISWKTRDTWQRTVHLLNEDLTGFEMVVTSQNNGAVENISDELPSREAIDERWRHDADYFRDLASFALSGRAPEPAAERAGAGAEGPPNTPPVAWGLVAARLGNSTNRRNFSFRIRQGDPERGLPGLMAHLKAIDQGEVSPRRTWTDAQSTFAHADQKVRSCLAERAQAARRRDLLDTAPSRVAHAERAVDHAERDHDAASAEWDKAMHRHRDATAVVAAMNARIAQHREIKPSWIADLLSLGRAGTSWRDEHETFIVIAAKENETLEKARRDVDIAHMRTRASEDAHAHALRESAAQRRQRDDLAVQCQKDAAAWGDAYPGSTGEARARRAPWLDEELDIARSELFLAALDLHRDLIENAAHEFRPTLHAAIETACGESPENLEPDKRRAAWQALFLLVPLVSSTFASVPRMLKGLGSESLGWLFVDEAGQAAPQLAAGAIWRFERALVVGDPMQLEPIAAIPAKAALDIAAHFDIHESWLAPAASTQTLADRVSVYGTTIRTDDREVWVGSPLQVHRRCDDPMFSISNQIAYGGLMVTAVRRLESPEKDPFSQEHLKDSLIAPSYWSDHPATVDQVHRQPDEIAAFRKALSYLASRGVPDSEILAISPFRSVADALRSETQDRPDLLAGSVHVAQGREADVVILVLGGARDRPGARKWAASSPNLLNVAVTRAKRRLYVIGDRSAWKDLPHFRVLASQLRPRP